MVGMDRSPAREFGHASTGYAVEFNFAGFACRSLTVETQDKAEMIEQSIKSKDGTSDIRVVADE
ncbi:hypothetical protein [Natrinema sp. CBA1119]|uniref:hypothetical protein n=1 Tax=Natrinema sp. CBA1119 TaxID=1608465 RepID=UPI0011454C8A|nr:hypothetical protein [Natrinema sp. CBA1119]